MEALQIYIGVLSALVTFKVFEIKIQAVSERWKHVVNLAWDKFWTTRKVNKIKKNRIKALESQ